MKEIRILEENQVVQMKKVAEMKAAIRNSSEKKENLEVSI
jgi:hypothetical protein